MDAFLTAVLVIAAGAVLYALLRRKASAAPLPQPNSVTLDGDSILFSIFLQRSIAARMRELRPGWQIEDRSAVGLKLQAMLAGYDAPYPGAPLEYFPRGPQPPYARVPRTSGVVVIEAGGNDALNPRPLADWEADMRAAIEIVRAEGRTPVLTGIVDFEVGEGRPADFKAQRDAFNEATHRLAAEYGLQHAGWGEDHQGPQDTIDGLHRSQAASDRLAALLVAAIERATAASNTTGETNA
jgi:acyl-CoA thioesterase I